VAGIIAARAGNGIGIEGVAPEAKLMTLRACWQVSKNLSQCNSFTLGKALNSAINHSAQVINLSVTGPSDRLLHRLLDAALVRDIKVVGAMDPLSSDGGFPASHPSVLPVTDDPSIPDTASRIAARVLIAPGRDVPTTLPGARWGLVSGSSFAAAHVSGLVSLLTELQPSIKPAQLREAMMISSVAHRTPEAIDACAAVMRVTGLHSCASESGHATSASHIH
jgi:subtilisin family serine protease